ncbi:hypothetical protein [Catenuloplanes atrovinosus]|uniref:hypothetical protein n=1 Tax=Catenuloplanes atrovinosus TaxID=137266 RepID=UPI00286A6D64|nr:hypothetical protein [Catenuloplanes atrovinosus]
MPPLLAGLVDDAALVSGGTSPLDAAAITDAASVHREHLSGWYSALVGPLLLPATAVSVLPAPLPGADRPEIAVIADTGLDGYLAVRDRLESHFAVRHIEVAVAKRGEDPQPGLHRLIRALASGAAPRGYAEIPLSWGLLGALDTVASARAAGAPVGAKFRTGGLAAELFPTPVELAAVICACRERDLPFKLTAGPHHALRSADPETGFVHHGFLNVLVATLLAVEGGEVADVAEALAATDPVRLIEPVRVRREEPRPLWEGFGTAAVIDPLTDLIRFGLVDGGFN